MTAPATSENYTTLTDTTEYQSGQNPIAHASPKGCTYRVSVICFSVSVER